MNKDSHLIHEAYRKQFNDSNNDTQDLLRVIYYNLQEPGDVTPPKPMMPYTTAWEGAMDAIKMAIHDAAMEGVDLTEVGYGLRDLEDKKYFSASDASIIVDMINNIEQEIDEIDDEF